MKRDQAAASQSIRRARIGRLIALGAVVEKSGLAEAAHDDLEVILGACLTTTTLLRSDRGIEAAMRLRDVALKAPRAVSASPSRRLEPARQFDQGSASAARSDAEE